MTDRPVRLTLERHVDNVAVARSFITSALTVLDVADTVRDKARLVVSELVTQLVRRPDVASVIVEMIVAPDLGFTVQATDFDPPELPDDVMHILDSLSGIRVAVAGRTWVVSLERE